MSPAGGPCTVDERDANSARIMNLAEVLNKISSVNDMTYHNADRDRYTIRSFARFNADNINDLSA